MAPIELTADRLRELPLPLPEAGSKEERGTLLVVGGSIELPGAALLAGTAALRAGAGRLRIATAASVAVAMAVAMPEARVVGLPEDEGGEIDAGRAEVQVSGLAKKCDAILIGTGMGSSGGTRALTLDLLARHASSLVLDAGALGGLRENADAMRSRSGHCILTPHAGEMAGLLDIDRDAVETDPAGAALEAAGLLQAVVVMKGAETWIVNPEGERWHYAGGGVGLATSGSGDVLAGLIAGLLARGAGPVRAAIWSVFLHGEAGARLARSVGPLGFLAREIAAEVPRLLAEIGG
ncbi:MAG: NAD(P)H-hydrate dehydratase [Methylobacterium sp.]|uniref:NAD(P)H-hydrate dehydratase n=1 Tax=Methylobacterium sp. TaxID=409 RepID=UPI0025CBA993|nr:NAD(P)H-hydrate dehydratase [Methylobacterium sp.]MBX9930421.1 NAD(P)H-hydrate dehydratase [Methylobacterium sp.]